MEVVLTMPTTLPSGNSLPFLPCVDYESFICKSSFLHSPSRAIKKNVRLGRSLYNTLFRESAMLDE